MLGFWLIVSPFVFYRGAALVLSFELICGFLVMIFGFLSFWRRTGWTRFLTVLVGLVLIGYGWFSGYPSPPHAQNQIITGILLAMFAIIPNRVNEIPEEWREFYINTERKP
jgi:hypothetical protein